ncbi:MAG: hypothetical protein H6852_11615 [Geminicoccaceae bacterium]|nr:hypothetical protein [Geminicoccaceae bacterium]
MHDEVFAWVLQRLAEHGLIRPALGVWSMPRPWRLHAALRAIATPRSGEGYRRMPKRLAVERRHRDADRGRPDPGSIGGETRQEAVERSGLGEPPTTVMPASPRMKDSRTRLAYKPEHAADLDTGAVLASPSITPDRGDAAPAEDDR